jgi:hypothetical protein
LKKIPEIILPKWFFAIDGAACSYRYQVIKLKFQAFFDRKYLRQTVKQWLLPFLIYNLSFVIYNFLFSDRLPGVSPQAEAYREAGIFAPGKILDNPRSIHYNFNMIKKEISFFGFHIIIDVLRR